VAAALNRIGGLLGTKSFPTNPSGYAGLLAWLRSFGTVGLVGVEGTGSYGAGLTVTWSPRGHGGRGRPLGRQERYRSGKSIRSTPRAQREPRCPEKLTVRPRPGRHGRGDPGVDGASGQLAVSVPVRSIRHGPCGYGLTTCEPVSNGTPPERWPPSWPPAAPARRRRRYASRVALRELGRRASTWPPRSTTSTDCCCRWSRCKPRVCSTCTESARTPPRC